MRFFALLTVLAVALSGCATAQRYDAAGDVHALLVAIRDDDRAAFEHHIDRPALKRQIEGRILRESRQAGMSDGWKALGALLARPAAELAGEALVQPRVFRAVAAYYGYTPDRPLPGRLAIGSGLRPAGDGRVCAPRRAGGPCLLVFEEQRGIWRLVGFEGELSDLRAPPGAPG